MKKIIIALISFLFVSCGTSNYYIVRHAEKEAQASNMSGDVPLSALGMERAEALKNTLLNKKIQNIFSTNTIRTKSTVKPISNASGIDIEIYDPRDTSFVTRLKNINKGNILVVGHSNAVDDIVNQFTGESLLQYLPDTAYGDLFITKKKGKK